MDSSTRSLRLTSIAASLILLIMGWSAAPLLLGRPLATTAAALGGYTASEVLGQEDVGASAIFTASGADNSIDHRGFAAGNGVVLDATNHRLYVLDSGGQRVLVFDLNGSDLPANREADYVLGVPDFRTVGQGTATASGVGNPQGIVLDEAGQRLFVSDSNHRIMVFDVASITNGENAVNVLGQANFTSSSAGLTQSTLDTPRGLAYDPGTNLLYVADEGNRRVMVFDVASITNGENAVNVLGQANFTSEASALTQNGMNTPRDVAIDTSGDRLFVVDRGNNRIMVFDVSAITDGDDAINVLGQGDFTSGGSGTTQSTLSTPSGVTYSVADTLLYVVDESNDRVMVFSVSAITDGENAVNVLGQADFTSGTAATTQARLSSPTRATVATSDILYVQDSQNRRVLAFNVATISNGESAVDALGQLDEAGQPYYTSGNDYNSANEIGLESPGEFAIDGTNHRLFVADTSNHRVLIFNLDTDNTPLDRAADFVLGQADFKGQDANRGGSPLAGTMSSPKGIAYDTGNERLFVADADNNRILIFDVSAITNGEDAVNVLGQANFSDSACEGAPGGTDICPPAGLAYDPSTERLYVADSQLHRVLVFAVDVIGDDEAASSVLGQADFNGTASGLSQSQFNTPSDVDVGSITEGETSLDVLFVTDQGNCRIMVFDVGAISDGEDAGWVIGQSDFDSNSCGTSASSLSNTVQGSSFHNSNLYVADNGNNRILIFDVTSVVNGESATDVMGQSAFDAADAATTASGLSGPQFVDGDSSAQAIIVSDSGNNRILFFPDTPSSTPTPQPGGGGSPPNPADFIGFVPRYVQIQDDATTTADRNVLVQVGADVSSNFSGTVDVLLSNTPDFTTFTSYRYVLPDPGSSPWPKVIGWDLCWGLAPERCNPGLKTVYARFYVNRPEPVSAPSP